MGFWGDLGDRLLDMGQDELSSRFNSHYGIDHIQAQNDTVAYLGQVIDAVQRRTFTVEEGVTLIQRSVNEFTSLASRAGERGRRGAGEVAALAAQVIRDLRAGSQPAPGGGYDPGGYYDPSGFQFEQLSDYVPYIIGFGGLYLVLSRGRR